MQISHNDKDWSPRHYGVVAGLFCGIYMITIALNTKMIDLYGWFVPCGLLTFPICAILTDILTEVYGFNRARKAIWTALICALLFAVLGWIAIQIPPAPFYQNQAAFEAIFSQAPRIALAGCAAWIVGEIANSIVVSKMKIAHQGKNMSLRFIASTAVGQTFDSLVFCTIAFAGTLPMADFMSLFLGGTLFKIAYEVVFLPVSVPMTKLIKKSENVDHFDHQKLEIV